MKTGDIIYLCEEEFVKLKQIYELIKTTIYFSEMKDAKISNRFILIKKKLNSGIISFEDEIVDFNLYNCVEAGSYSKANIRWDYDDNSKLKMKFEFDLNLLTVIL